MKATYTIAYIAHAPLEPRAAVAEWDDGKLTVWTGTQRPFGVRGELAPAFGLPPDKVRVIVPDTGSGYGGKHTGEAAIEAARLAKAAGKPVKLVWTREEEFTWAYFRPAGRDRGDRRRRRRTARSPPGSSTTTTPAARRSARRTTCRTSRTEFHSHRLAAAAGLVPGAGLDGQQLRPRVGTWTSWPHAVGMDPLEFRLKNLQGPRLRAVLEAAAKQFGWGKAKPAAGRGFGLAVRHREGRATSPPAPRSRSTASGEVRVVRVVTAFECGAILNPDHLKNQVEGCVVMGLGGALFEEIDFEDGKILNPTLRRLPRAAVPRRAGARDGAARPQGPAVGGRRRDADHRRRPGDRQRDLPGDRHAAAVDADGPEGAAQSWMSPTRICWPDAQATVRPDPRWRVGQTSMGPS